MLHEARELGERWDEAKVEVALYLMQELFGLQTGYAFYWRPGRPACGDVKEDLTELMAETCVSLELQPGSRPGFELSASRTQRWMMRHQEAVDSAAGAAAVLAKRLFGQSPGEAGNMASALWVKREASSEEILGPRALVDGLLQLRPQTVRVDATAACAGLEALEAAAAALGPGQPPQIPGDELAERLGRAFGSGFTFQRKSPDHGEYLIRTPFETGGDPVEIGLRLEGNRAVFSDTGDVAGALFSTGQNEEWTEGFKLLEFLTGEGPGQVEIDFDRGELLYRAPLERLEEGAEAMLKVMITMTMTNDYLAREHPAPERRRLDRAPDPRAP